jgi:hypothetical protein
MSGTQLFSLRIPSEIMVAVDDRAAEENRSRAQVIIMVLQEGLLGTKKRRVVERKPVAVKPASVPKVKTPATVQAPELSVSPGREGWCQHGYPTADYCKMMRGGC